jgi:uncharacterized membrane protein YvlD (DUF360 family)
MSTVVVTQNAPQAGLDIGQVFKRGWDLFIKDIGSLIVGGIIAVVLSVLTLGILAGPLFAGLYGMVVNRVRDGKAAEVGDVFGQMDRFWSFFVAALVLGILIGLASITIVGGVLLATIWLYVFPLMVDRRMGLGDAMKASKDMVLERGFWQHCALVIITIVIGSIANGLLALLATPFVIALTAAAYFEAGGEERPASAA